MKQSDLIVLGLAAAAVFMILRKGGAIGAGTGPTAKAPSKGYTFTREIFDTAGKPFSNGWRYYDDGTSIDPDGNYYRGGQMVWSPPKG